jgi:hypothetical protein
MPDGPECTCGGTIPAGRRDGFCSSWCLARDAQGLPPASPPPARPTVLTVAGASVAASGEQRPARRSVVAGVEAALDAAALTGSWQAAAALDLAEAIDRPGQSGSARAALHRELRSLMGEALRGTDAAGSAVGGYRDELAKRRARRTEGA